MLALPLLKTTKLHTKFKHNAKRLQKMQTDCLATQRNLGFFSVCLRFQQASASDWHHMMARMCARGRANNACEHVPSAARGVLGLTVQLETCAQLSLTKICH
jgi:hypothetical protein